ncbi:MAG: tetratricopeptide repeat protein, partial [Chitinispirillia bacterium]
KAFRNNSLNINLLLKTSKAYKKSNNYTQALDFLEKYKADFYSSKQVTKEIGLIKYLLKDTANAFSILETCINIDPPDSNVYLILGDIYVSKGLYENAISMYLKAEHLVKDTFKIKLALSNLYFIQKDYFKAQQGFLSILSMNSKYPRANQSLADIYFSKGKKKEALQHYLKEKSYHGSNMHIQKRIGQIYYEQKDYANADKEFKKLITIAPSDPYGYYQLTRIALKQKKGGEARNYFEKGEIKGKADIITYKELGEGFAQIGSFTHAINSLKKGLQLDSKNEAVLIDLGKIYEKAGRDNDAAQVYMNVYNMNKMKNSIYLAEAGHLLYKMGKKEEAYIAYAELIKKGYRKPDVAINMATLEFEKKQYEKVIPLLTNLDKKRLAEEKIASMLALSYYYTDNYKFAIPHINILLEKSPSKEIVEIAAFIYEKTEQLPLAISMYKKFLSFNKTDKHKKYAYHIAILYEKQKDFSSAETQYIKNLTDYPDDFRNYSNLVKILLGKNMYSKAILYLKMAIEKPSCPPEFFKTLTDLYIKSKKENEAAVVLQKYLKLKPNDTDALLTVGSIYYSMKSFNNAIIPLQKYHNLHPNDTACLNMLAESYINTGNISKAISIYNKIIINNPNNENALKKLSDLYKGNKKMVEAANIYIKIFQINKSKNRSYLSNAGHIYYGLSMYPKASKYYSMFLNSGYKDSKVSINLAAMEFKNKNYQKVITLLTGLPDKDIVEKEVIRQLVASYKNTGKETDALPYIKKLLTKDPKNIKNIEMAAIVYEKNGDLNSAVTMYKKFLASPKTAIHKDYAYHLAELYEKQNAESSAINQYSNNITLYPDDLRNYKKLSQYYEKTKNYNQAVKILTKAVKIPSAPPAVTKKLAEVLVLQKKVTQAALEYEKYVKKVTNDYDAWYSLGSIYYSLKKYKNAIIPFEKVLQLKPSSKPTLYKLGNSYIRANQIEKAVKPLEKALELSENDMKVLKLLTLCYTHKKDTASLISAVQKQADISRNDFQLHFKLGELLLKNNKNEQAIQSFEKAHKLKPKDISTHLNLITLYTKVKNKKKMISHIDQVLRFAPKNADIHYKKALFHVGNNDIVNAKASFKKTIQLKPNHHVAHFKYAELLEKERNYKTANSHYYKAVQYNEKNVEYLIALARTSEIIGKKSFAVKVINEALKLKPGEGKVVQFAGFIYYKSGQKKKAVDLLLQGIELDENCSFCYEIIGTLYYSKNDYAKAAKYLEKAAQLNSKNDTILLQYANALYFQKKLKQAQTYYSKAFTTNPKNDEALYRLCEMYLLINEIGKAELIIKGNTRKKKSGWIHLTEASIYEASNRIDEAYKSYLQALKIMPKNFEVLMGLGNVLLLQKKYNTAIKYYSKAMILRPDDSRVFINMGKAYYFLENYTAAIELFREIAKKEKDKIELYHMMGLTYSKLKKHNAAIKILKEGLKIKEKDADLQFTLGKELKNTLQFEES